MKMSQFLWRLGGYRPWLYGADVVSNILFQQFRIVFGLLIQAFFNALTPNRHLSLAIWVPLVLVAVTALTRFCVFLCGTRAYILHRFSVNSLLRRNLLERILEQPGAQADRHSARPRHACWYAKATCWYLTTCPAPSTWRQNKYSGSASSHAGELSTNVPVSSSHTGGRCYSVPITSSSSKMGEWRPREL